MLMKNKTKEEEKEFFKWYDSQGYGTKKKSLIKNLKTFSLIDHKAYVFYRENSELVSRKNVANYVEYGKLISTFYDIVGDELVNSLGGVYIKDFGYFGILRYVKAPKTKMAKDKQTGEYKRRLNTTEDFFFTSFVPISKNNKLRIYSMDISYYRKFREKLYKKLVNGWIYTFNASLFFHDLNMRNIKYK